ncbi:non-ribosomal peptide synthetase [Pyxidicoccus trucidator]|uniref:non-ribosomal peptide synthetase n=1 Tax=Pyxidicoccus trucidator TaxID=2709662 RepID=UPI001F08274C
MVPSAFVQLEALPLTSHGKVDRKALPAPEAPDSSRHYVAPRTQPEAKLAALIADVLRLPRVGVHDDFFALGGHSLLATQVVSRIRKALGVELPLRALFEAPTVEQLATRLEKTGAHAPPPPITARVASAGPVPASFAQERLWFLDQLEPGSAAYNIPAALRFEGRLDGDALAKSLWEVMRRHESLRTTFAQDAEGRVVSVPHAEPLGGLRREDLRGVADPRARVQAEAEREAKTPFDLKRGPLVRARLLVLSEREHMLLFTMHHIVSDAWSLGVLVREVMALYEAFAQGRASPLAPLAIQYADYAVWQREWLSGAELERQVGYWKRHLEGAPATLELPTDKPRPPVQTFNGAIVKRSLGQELSAGIDSLSQRLGATPFMALLSAFAGLLGRYSNQQEVVVGTPIANRTRAETEPLIGFFANTLALRTDLSGAPTFEELVGRVKEMTLGAYAHQDLPFEKVVEALNVPRDMSRSPVFQVMFSLQNASETDFALPELRVSPLHADSGTSKFDLMLYIAPTRAGYSAQWEFNSDLFEPSFIESLAAHFERFIEGALVRSNTSLYAVPLLSRDERRGIVSGWNATETRFRALPVHALFEEAAHRFPEVLAAVFDEKSMTYAQLHRRSNQLARYLQKLGVTPHSLVGMCLERSLEVPIAVLGILKAGAAYVPLDPTYPTERLRFMAEDARAPVLVTQTSLRERVEGGDAHIICLDDCAAVWRESDAELPLQVDASGLCYVLYTSGSTGRPKGAALTHETLANLVQWQLTESKLGPGDRTLQFSPLSFDVSFDEMLSTWAAGGTLVLVSEETRRDPRRLVDVLVRDEVARIFIPFVALRGIAEAAGERATLTRLREVVCGGEQLQVTPEVVGLFRQLPGSLLHNQYGPTETHFVTGHRLEGDPTQWPRLPPIGKPIFNTQMYVLDGHLEPVPVGVRGDLYIAGVSLARCYWQRGDLTADRFLPNPFSEAPGARMYRTGDVARYLPDGGIEFLGRTDHQVKVRGFRIELAEVEAALMAIDSVGTATVVAREDRPGLKQLVGYVVPKPGVSLEVSELREGLKQRLPEYMVPSAFAVLERMPLTPSGKIDRRALPAADAAGFTNEYVAPRTPGEASLARIWQEVLKVERVGVHDNFFELGGHSLLATQVVSRIRKALGIELELRALFEAPTVEALARRVEKEERSDSLPLTRVAREGTLPLSFAQQRLWFLDQLRPGDASYNLPAALRIEGALNREALEKALAGLAHRHESLRTHFPSIDGKPAQVISEEVPRLTRIDLGSLTDAARETEVRRLITEDAARPFDLARGPLLRMVLLELSPREHVLQFTMHHSISDGWSAGVMVRELVALYQAFSAGQKPSLPPLPVQYVDYAFWQRERMQGDLLDTHLAYWHQKLAGAPSLLELPTDRPRPAVLTFRGARLSDRFPRKVMEPLYALAQQEKATPFMALMAAFQVLLSRYSGQDDISVGSPISGRTRPELEGLVGFFVNTLVLRARIDTRASFRELLRQTRDSALEAYAHQDVPFERLVEELNPQRSLGHTPLFQVMLVLQNQPQARLELPGLDFRVLEAESQATKFDITLTLNDEPTGLAASVNYNAELFDTATVQRLLGHLRGMLAAAAEQPDVPLAQLSLLTETERHQLLVEWNPALREESPQATLPQLFSEQARRTPDAQAVICGEAHLSFRHLEARANQLAHRLRALGVGPDSPVVLCMERSVEALVAILGTLKAGGGYVPVDPSYPREWKDFVLRDTRARVILTQRHLCEALPASEAVVLCLGEDGDTLASESTEAPRLSVHPDHLAYVIYTSGSTGRPKGVMISHRSALHLREALASTVHASSRGAERVSVNAPLSFDASVKQLIQVLDGHTLCLVPEEDRGDIARMLRRIELDGLNVLDCSPAHLRLLVAEGLLQRAERTLRRVLVGGEAVDVATWTQLAHHPRIRFFNVYGPTECTVDATACALDTSPDAPVIGQPLPGVPVYVLDSSLQPVPAGIPGELFIGGFQVARGYLNRPELTAERFIPDAFSGLPGARLYRTGDQVRWRATGQLEYLHRIDHQVKVRGFRIEPGEVESALLQHSAVKEAVVVARQDVPGDTRLVAYAVARGARELAPDAGALRDFLRQRLPEHMVPSAFVLLEALPLTANGKVDRRALPAPSTLRGEDAVFIAPRTPVQQALAGIWERVLHVDRVGLGDNFFTLGGHSLLATQAISQIRGTFQLELSLRSLFEAPTLEELATRIELARSEASSETMAPLTRQPREGALPLSFAQQRLWFLDQFAPGDATYNIPAALRVEGVLDVETLRRAFEELVRRHEALRTTLSTLQGSPQQLIHPPHTWSLPAVDLTALPAHEREAQARELALREAQRPFSLSTGPLLRTQLLKLGDSEHVLLVCMHHVVSDGWSMGVLVREVAALYEAFTQGRPSPLPELPVQYADYALWQRQWLQGPVLQAQLDYWRQQLHGAPTLELPTDKPRPPLQSQRGASVSFSIPTPTVVRLHQLAHESGSTLFMVLMAAWQALLGRYSGQDDISVGTPIANRTRHETEPLIGFFVNTLVLRTRLEGDPTFVQLLSRVKEASLAAFAHQDVPFEQLVDALGVVRDLSRMPLFQVIFALQNAPMQAPSFPSLRVEQVAVDTHSSKFDLVLAMNETDGALSAQLEYCVDLFEHSSAERLTSHFHALLQGIAANPHRPLSQLPPEAPLQLPPVRQQAPKPGQTAPIEFVAPRTPLEESLAAIWTEVLEVPTPGVHDNFFHLGGSSLFSIVMLARVQETLGVELAPKRFFEAPTIAALAAALQPDPRAAASASPGAPQSASPLVLLNPGGTLPPLFCVHPVGGDVLCYAELARRLDPDQPFYGLRAQGLDGTQEPGQSIDAMARFYLDSIRQRQPSGPYRLMGWSMGGGIAFEMARQLEAQGEQVEFLALIDAHAHPGKVLLPDVDLGEAVKALLAFELQQFAEHLDHPRMVALRKLLEHHLRALSVYEPGPYGGEFVLLQATEVSNPAIQEQDNGWRPLASAGLQVHRIPGNHHSILWPPNVDILAQQLRACLRQLPQARSTASGDRQAS